MPPRSRRSKASKMDEAVDFKSQSQEDVETVVQEQSPSLNITEESMAATETTSQDNTCSGNTTETDKKKKKKKRSYEFTAYISKYMREKKSGMPLKKKAVLVLNTLLKRVNDKIITTARDITLSKSHKTIGSNQLVSAILQHYNHADFLDIIKKAHEYNNQCAVEDRVKREAVAAKKLLSNTESVLEEGTTAAAAATF